MGLSFGRNVEHSTISTSGQLNKRTSFRNFCQEFSFQIFYCSVQWLYLKPGKSKNKCKIESFDQQMVGDNVENSTNQIE